MFACACNTGVVAKIVDPHKLPEPKAGIPGLKPPVREFDPSDDTDPSEADRFNEMIRQLRNQSAASPRDVG